MNSSNLNENNPFLNNEIDKLCIICNYQLIPSETYSIFHELSDTEPKINVFNVLERVSNFKQIHITNGPQKICHTCYNTTIAVLRFLKMCEQSISFLESYKQHHVEIDIKQQLITIDPTTIEFPKVMAEEELTVKTEIDSGTCEEQDDTLMPPEEVTIKSEFNCDNDDNKQENEEKQTNKIECEVCHKYYTVDYLRKHRRVHTGERPYGCDTCDKRFKNPTDLKTHIQCVHSDVRDFLCNTCGKAFKILARLKTHERIVHNNVTERPHKCDFCGKWFQDKTYLRNHYSVHTKAREFECKTCGKSFKFKYVLNKHLKLHTDERPHECTTCGKRFKSNSNLKNHLVTHSNKRPLVCEVCGKSFSSARYLSQHMIGHEDMKRHECHLCGNRFYHSYSLTTHLSKNCKKNR